MKPAVLVICGPTASGKKRLALDVAERFGGEIVSADSRKVYTGLDIGTAKPSPADRRRVPHHLIDIVAPDEPFNAAEWVRLAAEAVSGILERGALPIISGGTGFYIDAFINGLSLTAEPDAVIRERLGRRLETEGPEVLYRELQSLDPERAAELEPGDSFRVVRSLELVLSQEGTFDSLRDAPRLTGGEYRHLVYATCMERPALYARIDERAGKMVEKGLVEEVRGLLEQGYDRNLNALDTVGYKEWFPFLDGTASQASCLEQMKRNTRRYAKRQLTWFGGRDYVEWMDAESNEGREAFFALLEKRLTHK